MSTSPSRKTFEVQANASIPRGATIRLTVEYRSKINEIIILIYSNFDSMISFE